MSLTLHLADMRATGTGRCNSGHPHQRAGSIPAMWRRLVRREHGSIPCESVPRKVDNSRITCGETNARGHGKGHVNLLKIPL